ncbi:putative disease resistance protein RGA3 [Bienertia sinuspersici]
MEAIAIGLAVDAAKAITTVVAGRAFEEIRLVWFFKVNLEKLKTKFQRIQDLLEDLGSKDAAATEQSRLVNGWLKDVKEVAYSAENLMDDYQYELLRRKLQFMKINRRSSFKKKWRNYVTAPSTWPIVFRVRMTHRVNQILWELDELDEEANRIGLKPVELARDAVSSAANNKDDDTLAQIRERPPMNLFIGRDDDENKLLEILCNPTADHQAHTTLARHLYEHKSDEGPFDGQKAWICVSKNFNAVRLLKELVESVTKTTCDLKNIGAIMDILQDKLRGNKLFLVLDDVWNDNKDLWDSLKSDLKNIGVLTGSVILITTRIDYVAKAACASDIHKLEGLSKKDEWALLKQLVSFDSSFDEVARRILDKCKGVPLAIKAIGGMNPSSWYEIEKSELWDIQIDDKDYIMPSLLLSYNHLKHVSVKQCFAYCAIFPKGMEMEKDQLIALWLAQGFLHDDHKFGNSITTMEAIGEKYISILVNHSLFQEETEGYKTWYKMHDLVHDLATYVSRDCLLVWNDGVTPEEASHHQHMAFNLQNNEMVSEIILTENEIAKVRAIALWDDMPIVPRWNLQICPNMRTLIMVNCGLREVATILGEIVHLRYLDLSGNNIEALPESICKLYQLQTLRLLGCFRLQELPRELHKLENLKHLQTSEYVLVPKGLRQLSRLQTLPYVKLYGEGWSIDELGSLDQVKGEICIKGLEHVKSKEEAREAGLNRKDKIWKLDLKWDNITEESSRVHGEEDILDNLEPHPNIQSIRVSGFNGLQFPWWISTMSVKQNGHPTLLSNLKEVYLSNCDRCQHLPSLGGLPHLEVLRLYRFKEVKYIGEEFYQSSNNYYNTELPILIPTGVGVTERNALFPNLRRLYICGFWRLVTWAPPSTTALAATTLPKLEILQIIACPQLKTIPFVQLQCLKTLELNSIGGSQALDIIKYSNNGLISLKLEKLQEMRMLPHELLNCSKLQVLLIVECNVVCIPGGLTSLTTLDVRRCPSLANITLDGLPSLRHLSIRDCPSLSCIPHNLPSLRKLSIMDCQWLRNIPTSLEDCTSLEHLQIQCCPITIEENPVPNISKLQRLTSLILVKAGELSASSPWWLPYLHRLVEVNIGGLTVEWDITLTSSLTSLKKLLLRDCPNFKPLSQLSLQHLSRFSTLEELSIIEFYEMEALPEWIGNLSSLVRLNLGGCNKLKYLPSQQAMLRLSRLQLLLINGCPLLIERCDKDNNGPESEWHKISHVTFIKIDEEIVQDFS